MTGGDHAEILALPVRAEAVEDLAHREVVGQHPRRESPDAVATRRNRQRLHQE